MRRWRGAAARSAASSVMPPGSVGGGNVALRSFAAFLAETSSAKSLVHVTRRHVGISSPGWLSGQARPNRG